MIRVFVVLFLTFGVVIEEFCHIPLYFYTCYHLVSIWMMMKTLSFWKSLHHVFLSESNGFVINKVFQHVNNVARKFSVISFYHFFEVFIVDQTVVHV